MTSWKDCTNEEYESPKNPRPYWNFYDLEIHQKKAGPDYHRLKTMVKRSIEQHLQILTIEKPEMEIMKETPWSRIREQNSVYKEFLEIVGNGSPTGSVLEETIAVFATISISVEK